MYQNNDHYPLRIIWLTSNAPVWAVVQKWTFQSDNYQISCWKVGMKATVLGSSHRPSACALLILSSTGFHKLGSNTAIPDSTKNRIKSDIIHQRYSWV